ncbi:hypothetical protein CDR19_16350 [Ectopseudomonas toyotomiensis]|uniref:DUF2790 domain-containing protein n=1 Tax=Ectopseudomonas toyotomiensis TaxID=554344 RepID=A0A1I5XTM2_9GAMM|nr:MULTISPECIES: DUF2790 domain-containing protein [Pseudomonas]AQZ32985.1 hypothetical protein BHQ29_06615 [Pseudomonas sp. LPH1]PIA70274.1 hypothetical protein CDR19_16350 [Pseudomonas toyotomiensis]SFQ35274.1 Protein of unknown function [Pseudomonas toyotomiensis]
MKRYLLAFAMLLAAGSAMAATQTAAPVIHDKTGFFIHLDIDRVLSSTDLTKQCGVGPAQLHYLDHQGREHVLEYQVMGSGCSNDN